MTIRRQANAPPADPQRPGPVVLQVLPDLAGDGGGRQCVQIAAAMVAAGGGAIVASAGGPLVHDLARAGARHLALPLDSRNPLVIRRNATRLHALIRDVGADLVHAFGRGPAWSAWSAAARASVPFLTTVQTPRETGSEPGSPLQGIYDSVMVRGDRVIAVSEFLARLLRDGRRVDPARIRTVPRGVDLARFGRDRVGPDRVIRLARDWRLPDGDPIVLMPAPLGRGQEVLLGALARLGRRTVHCVMLGADAGRSRPGRGGYRRVLEQRIGRLDLPGTVRLIESCADLPAAYMLCDVVAVPVVEPDGFDQAIIEAQAFGRPVIASDLGMAAEIIRPGDTGWLVPPDNVEVLAATLDFVLSLDETQTAALAERTAAHVAARFSHHAMTAATIEVYREMLDVARLRRGIGDRD